MRSFLFLVLLVFFAACSDEKTKKPSAANDPGAADTSHAPLPLPEPIVNTYAGIDISPMDMSYFPKDYPKIKMANGTKITPPVARVIYSRPHLARRRFEQVIKLNEPWRLGANESSEIEFYKSVTIQNKKVAAGRYIIYGIPQADKWTIALNSNVDTWGLKQDSTKDVHRFDIPVSINNSPLEYFTMVFEKSPDGANLVIGWDDRLAKLPIQF